MNSVELKNYILKLTSKVVCLGEVKLIDCVEIESDDANYGQEDVERLLQD